MTNETDVSVPGKSEGVDNLKPTLFIFGDSTGCNYAPNADLNYYYKRVGFGTRLPEYFGNGIDIKNYALSGRSSKNYITDSQGSVYYKKFLEDVKPGDFVIIAFGHNDEKIEDQTRYSEPFGDKNTEGSYKYHLYTGFIKPSLDNGAAPILCTPIVRRTPTGSWREPELHRANGGDYSQAVRELAAELKLTLIDSTSITKDFYDKLTADETVYLHAWTNSDKTSVDNTHLNNYGAFWVAYLVADALKKSASGLKTYLKDEIAAPNKNLLVVNPDYTERSCNEISKSTLWKTTDPWWGSVFGDVGDNGKIVKTNPETGEVLGIATDSASSKTYFNIEEISSPKLSFNVRAGIVKEDNPNDALTSVGKIAANTDGMALVFRIVDSSVNFSLSANANVNGIANNSDMVSFGAIVLDSVDIDYNDTAFYNYVAAAPLMMDSAVKEKTEENPEPLLWAGFTRLPANGNCLASAGRITGSMEQRKSALPKAGDIIPVKITKVANKYGIEYNGVVSAVTAELKDDVYVGFFAARCADITFTDVVFSNEVVEN